MSAKFDRVVLVSMEAKFAAAGGSVTAVGAFVSSATGSTHGSTSCHQWSPETVKALLHAKALMEQDMQRLHFDGEPRKPSNLADDLSAKVPGGLGEHLRGEQQG